VLTAELPGRTSAYPVAEIRPHVNGLIQNGLFREGSHVNAGELLYRIDPAPYQAAFSLAKAAVTAAKADLVTVEAREQVVRVLGQIAEQAAAHRATPLARSQTGATAPSQAGTRS
jgi:membrane fusion protein, multidrug efflux system